MLKLEQNNYSHLCGCSTDERNHHFYRPQTKFAKVMFLHVSVILSTVGVPGPGGGCLVRGGGGAWSQRGEGVWRPLGTTTAAGGTHPTGMRSCEN